jgi:hypothetical protein
LRHKDLRFSAKCELRGMGEGKLRGQANRGLPAYRRLPGHRQPGRVDTEPAGTGVGMEKEPGRADAEGARPGSRESLHGYFIQRPAKWHLRNPVF